MSRFFLLFSILVFFLGLVSTVHANDKNQFITLVNPVRISQYNLEPLVSFKAEYKIIHEQKLPATWLVTFDVMQKDDFVNSLKSMDNKQELGLFLEVTKGFAKSCDVNYNLTDSWHRANSIFLSGYVKEERIKLIDCLESSFKNKFGYYPKSVGSWWSDSFSLNYLQEKYGVGNNLGVADQFSTDGYQVWGQYWSAPFYPSLNHSAIPASSLGNKLDVVNLQWAPRDPLNSYGEGSASKYSSQDYSTLNLNNDYFLKLINVFGRENNNKFGQFTFGLEADLSPQIYGEQFQSQIKIVKELQKDFQITNMNSFGDWYREHFPTISPVSIIQTKDLLNTSKQVVWYQSPMYRLGLLVDDKTNTLELLDLRSYLINFQEPYYTTPNGQLDLEIDLPSLIDQVSKSQDKKIILPVKDDIKLIRHANSLVIGGMKNNISLNEKSISFNGWDKKLLSIFEGSPYAVLERNDESLNLSFTNLFPVDKKGIIFKDLSIKATYFLNRPKIKKAEILFILTIVLISLVTLLSKINFKFKVFYLGILFSALLLFLIFFNLIFSQNYFINQSEVDALLYLKSKPYGSVLVNDQGCLICNYHSEFSPAVFGNKRNYVKEISGKPVIYNSVIFTTNSRMEGLDLLKKMKIKYLYLIKFENFREKIPFSPGDYNLVKLYENANAQIFKVED